MEGLITSIQNFIFDLPHLTFQGIFEIGFLSYIIYKCLYWLNYNKSHNIFRGILVLSVGVFIAWFLEFDVTIWIVEHMVGALVFALALIFQNEIKQLLEVLGRKRWFSKIFGNSSAKTQVDEKVIREIAKATFDMSAVKTGALMVICRDDNLKYIINTGIEIDGIVTNQLIINIFEKNTPLHDGAVVIDDNIIKAATCYLPLSENYSISKDLGTRHRAALGISEITDSVTVIVSEETGKVRLAINGTLKEVSSQEDLIRELLKEFVVLNEQSTKKGEKNNDRRVEK